jgi:hypothetical protein
VDLNLATAETPHFIFGFNLAQLRRSGTKTARRQKLPEDLQEMYEQRVAPRQTENPRHHELRHAT